MPKLPNWSTRKIPNAPQDILTVLNVWKHDIDDFEIHVVKYNNEKSNQKYGTIFFKGRDNDTLRSTSHSMARQKAISFMKQFPESPHLYQGKQISGKGIIKMNRGVR